MEFEWSHERNRKSNWCSSQMFQPYMNNLFQYFIVSACKWQVHVLGKGNLFLQDACLSKAALCLGKEGLNLWQQDEGGHVGSYSSVPWENPT